MQKNAFLESTLQAFPTELGIRTEERPLNALPSEGDELLAAAGLSFETIYEGENAACPHCLALVVPRAA